ncbi:MAG: hypothetical protein PSV16_04995 [Flavobacterium sp.]|nr:hypothetical protein [Flavobacterium sp.]
MKRNIIVLVLFLSTFAYAFGQNAKADLSNETMLSESDFAKAKDLYLKMCNSESFKLMRENSLILVGKLGYIDNLDFYLTEENFINWISLHLSETKFNSVEEAIELRKVCLESQRKLDSENKEVYELIKLASKEQVREILKPHRLRL